MEGSVKVERCQSQTSWERSLSLWNSDGWNTPTHPRQNNLHEKWAGVFSAEGRNAAESVSLSNRSREAQKRVDGRIDDCVFMKEMSCDLISLIWRNFKIKLISEWVNHCVQFTKEEGSAAWLWWLSRQVEVLLDIKWCRHSGRGWDSVET